MFKMLYDCWLKRKVNLVRQIVYGGDFSENAKYWIVMYLKRMKEQWEYQRINSHN